MSHDRSIAMRGLTAVAWPAYVLILLGLFVVGVSMWLAIGRNLDFPWTSLRLAPAFALAEGYSLYSTPDKPPWVMVGYGPLYPVAYLPCVFARQPSMAVSAATLLAHFYVLVPAALIFSEAARQLGGTATKLRLPWFFSFLLFALMTVVAPSLTYVTAGVHADAPAFALLLLACYAMLRADRTEAVGWIAAAGVLVGLSACCKINLAPAALGCCLWLLLRARAKHALILGTCAAVAVTVVYGCAIAHDGFEAVWLNLRQLGKMPWFTFHELSSIALSGSSHDPADKLRTFLTLGRSYVQDYGLVAAAIILISPWSRMRGSDSRSRAIWFFLALALWMVPASIASIGKYGGDVNSRALVTMPLVFAAIFTLLAAVERGSRRAVVATYAALGGAIFMGALSVNDSYKKASAATARTMVEAYTVISADPSRWYFPYDPLAHLLAEGKFRPNVDVVYTFAVSGMPVDENAFRSALPEKLRYIAVPPSLAGWGLSELRRLLPEYSQPVRELQFERHQVLGP